MKRLVFLFGLLVSAVLARAEGDLPRPTKPAPVQTITGESIRLVAGKAEKWSGGTKLAHVQGMGLGKGLPVPHALNAASVVVHDGSRVLLPGKDYVVNGIYGTLSLGPAPTVTSSQLVQVDYEVGLRRIDSVIRESDGRLTLREGEPALTAPHPPALEPGEARVGNYFLDYGNTTDQARYLACSEDAAGAVTRTAARGLDKVLAKLRNGEPVRIVCWGDSVTAGGEASSEATKYPAAFAEGLRKLYPQSDITLTVIAVGGSQSRQWLFPDKYPHPTSPKVCDVERVLAAKADLVTVEFLNDAWMPPDVVNTTYADIAQRLHEAGSECIFITPNFTMPEMMGTDDLAAPDRRPYTQALAAFAESHGLALADASSRWAHLWQECIPYPVLLNNGINHPDDRGHALFVEELLKCLASAPAQPR